MNADFGIFLQDTWTTRRLTISPGVRFDHFNSSVPAQDVPAGRFVPARHFDAIPDVPNWNNVAPRFGASYDLTGQGRTAVKGNVGLYVQSQGVGFAQTYNPMVFSTNRYTWNDLNSDDIAQENELSNPQNSATFGIRRNQNPDPDIKRPYQWLWDIGLQHEVLSGLAVTVSYNQRSFHNLQYTTNLAIPVESYTLTTVANPQVPGSHAPGLQRRPRTVRADQPARHHLAQQHARLQGRGRLVQHADSRRRLDQRRDVNRPDDFQHLRRGGCQQLEVLRPESRTTSRCSRSSSCRAPIR